MRIVRRGSGSVVTWRRAQMVLLSAQGMDVAAIAKVAFTSEDRVRDVIRNFNADGFGSLYPRYYAAKKARIEHLYAIADRNVVPNAGEREVIFCVYEFGPLNLQPRPGSWSSAGTCAPWPARHPDRNHLR